MSGEWTLNGGIAPEVVASMSCDELFLIFYRNDIPLSLKMATRARMQGQQPAIAYRITDSTSIFKVPMKKL